MLQDVLKSKCALFADGVQTILRGQENRTRRVVMVKGNLVQNARSDQRGVSARVNRDGMYGFASVAEYTPEAAEKVIKANLEYVPPYGTGGSMYLRPLLIGTGPQIGVAPAKEYTFMIMVMPVGAYYKGGLKPVRAVILDDWDRAAPHGMGDVKVGGNYAASLFAHEKAKREGWPVELYLDAKEHKYVEEFSTSNFLGIKADGTYVTPDSCSVLPAVTNKSLKQCAADLGWKVECRHIPYEEIKEFTEVAACGTAVVVTPVWEITRGSEVIKISEPDAVGPHLQKLFDTVQGIQYGVLPDVHGWCHEVK